MLWKEFKDQYTAGGGGWFAEPVLATSPNLWAAILRAIGEHPDLIRCAWLVGVGGWVGGCGWVGVGVWVPVWMWMLLWLWVWVWLRVCLCVCVCVSVSVSVCLCLCVRVWSECLFFLERRLAL